MIKINKPTKHQKSKKKKLTKSASKWHEVIDPYSGENMRVKGPEKWIKEQLGGNKWWNINGYATVFCLTG